MKDPRDKGPSGADLAQFLTRCWRPDPPQCATDAAGLTALLPMLQGFGLAALAWWRIRHQALGESEPGKSLQQAYALHALSDKMQEAQIEHVIAHFRAQGIEPILLKGWSNARLYPCQGLRPLGDIDLLVQPHQFPAAQSALEQLAPSIEISIDLKGAFPPLYERDTATVFARSLEVPLRQGSVRVLAAEDQLRMLCLHLLRHGGWRPLWLVDIAVLLETTAPGFDWDLCLQGQTNRAQGVVCAARLAHSLLGADISGLPAAVNATEMPRWLAPKVLRLWQVSTYDGLLRPTPIKAALRSPRRVARELHARWPDPVSSAFTAPNVPASRSRVFPHQVALMMRKTRRYFEDGPLQ